jgi:hypothetical protein
VKRFVIALAVVASAAAQDSRLTEVRSILQEASALLPKVNSNFRGLVSHNIMGAQVRAGDIGAVLTGIEQIESAGERADKLAMVAAALIEGGDWRSAVRLLDERLPRANRMSGYSGVVRVLKEKGT